MNTAEVVIREVQGDSGFQVAELTRESVREPGQPPKLHSHGQILSLHVAGRNVLRVGIAAANFGYNLRDFSWGVPLLPMLPVISEQLGQLSKVGIAREGFFNGFAIENVSIRGQLNAVVCDTTAHVQHEVLGVLASAFAHKKRRNELGVRIKGHENPLVAKLCRIVLPNVPSFLAYKRPDFVTLDSTARQLTHTRIQQPFASLSCHDEQTHDGIAIQPGEPFCGSDRAAFKQALNGLQPSLASSGSDPEFRIKESD
jgi:hypothetical protein